MQKALPWLGRLALLLAGMLLVAGLAMWLDEHVALAKTDTLACVAGSEMDGGLCYPVCDAGYRGVGPVCYAQCPAGMKDDGALCRKDAYVFAKSSYGRGAGVSLVCTSSQESQNGLCYPRCNAGYYGVGPVCWQYCKAGYADHGATCYRGIFDFYGKPTYGRGAGGAVSACAAGLDRQGALCYPRCNAGYYGVGPVCFQACPAGYRDDGALCRRDAVILPKTSYPRGAGTVANSIPEAQNETLQTPKNTPAHLDYPFSDLDDDATTLIMVQDFAHGKGDNNTYTPNLDFEGVDFATWRVSDGKHLSNLAVTTVNVGNVLPNDAPVAVDRTVVLSEDVSSSISVTCTDANSDSLIYMLVDPPQHGSYEWVPPNSVIYTPTANFNGLDHFSFRSHDGRDPSNLSVITLTVTAVNDAPVAISQHLSTTRNQNAGIVLFASDAEGDPISYTLATSPTHGSLSGSGTEWVYSPAADFVGEDAFDIRVNDPSGAASSATISITVQPSNTAPLAQSLSLSTTAESALSIQLSASDVDSDPLTYTVVSSPTHGALSGAGEAWIYLPDPGFTGTDRFVYQASDGQLNSEPVTVSVQVIEAPAVADAVGIIFDDKNGNGQPDPNESGVGGLQVTLTADGARMLGSNGATQASYSTQTEASGAWRVDGLPFGQYHVQIASTAAVQMQTLAPSALQLSQRGLQQLPPAAVKVTGWKSFVPVMTR